MRLLYPSAPFAIRRPDDHYAEECQAALEAGIDVALFSFEDFESGRLKVSLPLEPGEEVLYRGWMLTPDRYAALVAELRKMGARELTSPAEYQRCHHLPEWYPLLVGHTSETLVLKGDSDFSQELAGLDWPGYFIKDYVKSLNTGSGSLVGSPEEIAPLVKLMLQYRGQIEGGICVRRREDYLEDTEQRYFVFQGQAYSPNAVIPELVTMCAGLIDSPFFSVDVALRSDGELRVIELGDGQVSDRKEWSVERFVEMLAHRQ